MAPTELSGPTVDFPQNLNVHSFVFSNPFQHAVNPDPKQYPDHTYDGQTVPPHKTSIIHDGSGATLSRARLQLDSLKVARSLRAIVGNPVACAPHANPNEPVHAPRTTVLLHLPNSLAWPILALGTFAASCTLSPISTHLSPRELAYILAKARPQVLVTTTGADGEGQLRKALDLLLQGEPQDQGVVKGAMIRAWARELAADWDQGRAARLQKGDSLPFRRRRVWTVDLAGGADYYGHALNKHGVSAAIDPRDWTNLLAPPPGSKQEGTIEGTSSVPFEVQPMSPEEQHHRAALMLWSSGTTGQSKGVLLSHRNCVANTQALWHYNMHFKGISRGDYGGGERWLALAPWCHVLGLCTLLLPAIALGATLVIPANPRFDLPTYLRTITKYRITFAHIAPAVAVALKTTPALDPSSPVSQGIDVSSISGFMTGGAPTSSEIIRIVHERTQRYIHMGYGTTETITITQTSGMGLDRDMYGPRDELGSVGFAAPNVSIRIQAPPGTSDESTNYRTQEIRDAAKRARERGERAPLDPSPVGEILVKAPAVMLGYFSGLSSEGGTSALDAEMTQGAFHPGGWYRSGDEGVFDAHGHVWITGRIKELIKVKGFQVPPAELDSLFAGHPKLADAGATSHQHEGLEEVLMLVVPKDRSVLASREKMQALMEELCEWVKDQTAHYKWPKFYLFAEAAPRNPTGKILRKDVAITSGTILMAPKTSRGPAKL
ncbi:uncharacterized protein PFL1_00152 [Pseudozyma flocculosa PF-1]|uniref:Related to 4-coumarate--CoA ligase 1 n=1 Tax=Pseudozyma flocculosa TaxID=84751 RepID=A0A5C3ES43_9BASI|nr:uncharacterized protein PFL1_00152 [Pseudozyma flocculosa PF-1]EPQ31953.1 hypothetical protein PFL1_00152 [Pseudozyma flocculosa PF-1]SPO35134.1 related to 4-coumarate--CoA ligase 1 [Pseudozyma flocculosa]